MQYEWKRVEKAGGGYRLSRVAVKGRKAAVTIEPAEPATVAKFDVDSGEAVAVEPVEVAAAPVKAKATRKPAAKKPATRG